METHLRQICGLEQQLRQQQGLRDVDFPSLSPPPAPAPPCADLDLHYLALRGGSSLNHGEISVTPGIHTPKSPQPAPYFNPVGHLQGFRLLVNTPFSSVQLLSCVQLFTTPWTAAHQPSLSMANSQSLLKLMSIESVMPSNHLIFCRPLLFPPSVFPSIRVFSNESAVHIR